jgi:hypothetical protein
MNLFKLLIALLVVLAAHVNSSAQETDTCNLRISLLTCGPGEDLYSLWGHTGIRIVEKNTGRDVVYNYGTFDFEDPDFYAKFTRGKLLYFVSVSSYTNFLYEYQYEGRSVIEQLLNISCEEKQRLFAALQTNAKEENKYYSYDFALDNCSTRPMHVILKSYSDSVKFKDIFPGPTPSFRNFIHENLDKYNQSWAKFGIDLALGSRLDRRPSDLEAMFLPYYVMKGFDSATVHNTPLVASKKTILNEKKHEEQKSFFTPLVFTVALLIIFGALSFTRSAWAKNILNVFDITYFLILGLLGCFLLFMWFGTDHYWCKNNYNLLWALPTHLPMAFVVLRNKPWIKKYFFICAIIYALLVIFWGFLPQGMNSAFFPLVVLAGIRSVFRSYKK